MHLIEQAVFTDKVDEMAAYYETLLNQPPVVKSEDMDIFMLGETKRFIHRIYEARKATCPQKTTPLSPSPMSMLNAFV